MDKIIDIKKRIIEKKTEEGNNKKKRIEGGESYLLKRLKKDSFFCRLFPPCTILNNIIVGEQVLPGLHLQGKDMQGNKPSSTLITNYTIGGKKC